MGENRTEIAAAGKNIEQTKNVGIIQATRKRMMLSEVYVHKNRKLDDDAKNGNQFEVFHIYEFDESDSNVKITPKLSTNCTEPRKIIDVLQNSTGSETPQLQRLIEKLCAQNKKWSEIQDNQNGNQNDNGPNDKVTNESISNMSSASNVQPTVRVSLPMSTQSTSTSTQSKSVTTPSNIPAIRLKSIDSLKETSKSITANTPKTTSTPKVVPVQKTVQGRAPVQKVNNGHEKNQQPVTYTNKSTSTPTPTPAPTPTVKLWNNVIQNNATEKDFDYLVVANKEEANKDNSVFRLKPTNEMIEHASGSTSSSLKIQQVFECVTDEFVEDLLVEKEKPPATKSNKEPSPPVDTILEQVVNNQNAQTNKAITFVPTSNGQCTDYRCNICLLFNDTYNDYLAHMCRVHQCNYVCRKCHEGFERKIAKLQHLEPNGVCTRPENAQRSFICIVDPPVILMKNGKVFAFKCKHCSLAFHNQRNYVHHAQRHAKTFRCKLCTAAKALTSELMQQHLKQH
ncbi:uncharacterized protein LOC116344339 [Contarinia nasturtii]|uniref:uncharacterized protein LOC116344339 n=1 Tax=Contarinia nasturtii TaxID=265458 RepID=UPI0012D38D53|nr:uncharacterized protein LOC116344339 [Contarinia nasturtii]